MAIKDILAQINEEIERLETAKKLLLAGSPAYSKVVRRRQTPEGRARIAAAQKRRWAAVRKAQAAAQKQQD